MPRPSQTDTLRVLQWNAGELSQSKRKELLQTLSEKHIDVFTVLEANLKYYHFIKDFLFMCLSAKPFVLNHSCSFPGKHPAQLWRGQTPHIFYTDLPCTRRFLPSVTERLEIF
ncbi:hypothetical protein TNCV_4794181 [Trichonephila clavipes]|nr:hypothetical protein TNCV_4794181 [Trichonephila clavipes]